MEFSIGKYMLLRVPVRFAAHVKMRTLHRRLGSFNKSIVVLSTEISKLKLENWFIIIATHILIRVDRFYTFVDNHMLIQSDPKITANEIINIIRTLNSIHICYTYF